MSSEYGVIEAKLDYVSTINNEGFTAKISFSNGLTTTYNRNIHYRAGLIAKAEIITRDMSLLVRFYYSIITITKE